MLVFLKTKINPEITINQFMKDFIIKIFIMVEKQKKMWVINLKIKIEINQNQLMQVHTEVKMKLKCHLQKYLRSYMKMH